VRRHLACLALLCAACRQPPAPVAAKTHAAATSAPAVAPAAAAVLAPEDRRWSLAAFAADVAVPDDQQLAGLGPAGLTDKLRKIVLDLPQFAPPPAPAVADPVGVQVLTSWQATDQDSKAVPILLPPGGGSLLVRVVAHAERMGAKPSDIAERTVEAALPFPAERAGAVPDFVFARLRQAVALAVQDAVGELWARRLTDPQVQALVGKGPLWQQMAGAREVGERKLADARPALEKAARDSRKDLAAVAAAALGRLQDDKSTPVLVALLDGPHLEVVDAALGALADIGGAAALVALKDAAKRHPVQVIRERAKGLLEAKPER